MLSVALLSSLAATAEAADDARRFAEHVPHNSCLVVFSTDVQRTCAVFEQSPLGAVFCGPDYQPLRDALRKADRTAPFHLRPAFGFDWKELSAVRDSGGLIVFPLANQTPGVAWLFTTRAKIDRPPALIVAVREHFQRQGFQAIESRQAGVAITTYVSPRNRAPARSAVVFIGANFYGVANSSGAVELLRVQPARSWGADPTFARADAELRSNAPPESGSQAAFCVRPLELWKLLAVSGPKPNAAAKERLESAQRLGLDGIEAVVGVVGQRSDGEQAWTVEAQALVKRPLAKALRLLELRPGPLPENPGWAGAKVSSIWRWNWDFSAAVAGFASWFDEASEPGSDGVGLFNDLLDGLRDDPEGVRVDLRKGLFAAAGNQALRVDYEDLNSPDETRGRRRWLYAFEAREPDKMIATLSRFYRDDKQVQHTTINGHEVWTVGDKGSLFVEGEHRTLVALRGIAVGSGRILLSSDRDLLSAAVNKQPDDNSVPSEQAWFQALDDQPDAPPPAALLQLRLDGTLRPSYEAITSELSPDDEPVGTGLWRLLFFGASQREPGLPYQVLPKFDRLAPALGSAAVRVWPNEAGWQIRATGRRASAP